LKIDDETLPDALLDEMDWKYAFGDGTTSYYEFAAGLCLANELGDVLHSIVDLQESILRELREEILEHASLMRDISRCVSEIDVLLAFADVAINYNMCRPTLRDDDTFEVEGAKQLLYESFIEGEFIGNDVRMPTDRDRVIVLTGPNGSGKTVLLQTIGLITYLAHCGSFVPATRAVIGVTDRIFTGMVALREDVKRKTLVPESGFTHALHQVARMINNSTRRSLCLVDEFGIQTQYADGAALLAAIVEHFGKRPHPPKVLFSTHFREICDPMVVGPIPHMVGHWRMRAIVMPSTTDDSDDAVHDVEMLFKLERGVADSSLALSACKRVGLPDEFMNRLKYLMQRDARARAGEQVPPLDPWGDPKEHAKRAVYKAIWDRFERARANPTDAEMDDFLAFFDSLALDEHGVPIV
jgi:DNA mismatch repair protein MSH5